MPDDGLRARMRRQYEEVILPHRSRRTAECVAALRGLDSAFDPDMANIYHGLVAGLLSHTFYACVQAEALGDTVLAQTALNTWRTPLVRSAASWTAYNGTQWLVIDSRRCINRPAIDRQFDTPCFLVSGDAMDAGFTHLTSEFWRSCWRLLDNADLLFLVETATEIIVHLRYRDMTDSLTGYSLFPLAGTVFTDWTDSPLRHAESIIHEAAHSYLNMLLAATGIVEDRGIRYWSPWRALERPAIGIVHGAWAFSVVHAFYLRLWLAQGFGVLAECQIEYCQQRSQYELARLEVVRPYLADALAEVGNPHVTALVSEWFPTCSLQTPVRGCP